MGRFRNIVEDAKKFLGIPPYNELNYSDKADLAVDCSRFWGGDAFSEVCQKLQQEYSLEKSTD